MHDPEMSEASNSKYPVPGVPRPRSSEGDAGAGEHLVVLYETDEVLARRVLTFLAPGLLRDEGLLVVATPGHRRLLRSALARAGADVLRLSRSGRYVELDAEETLAAFLVDGRVSRHGFNTVLGHRIRTMSSEHGRLHIYGEMVACLWSRGSAAQAVELEHLWNDLAEDHHFRLCCAYPAALLGSSEVHVEAMLSLHRVAERN